MDVARLLSSQASKIRRRTSQPREFSNPRSSAPPSRPSTQRTKSRSLPRTHCGPRTRARRAPCPRGSLRALSPAAAPTTAPCTRAKEAPSRLCPRCESLNQSPADCSRSRSPSTRPATTATAISKPRSASLPPTCPSQASSNSEGRTKVDGSKVIAKF